MKHRAGRERAIIPTIDLEHGMPRAREAVAAMEQALALARTEGRTLLKFIHGYGSTGVGGEIRIAVQKRLREMEHTGAIQACIFGEDWGTSDAQTWALLKARPQLKHDHDLGRRNAGITVVVL